MAEEFTSRPAAASSGAAIIQELVSKRSSCGPVMIDTLPVVEVFDGGEVEQFLAFVTKTRRDATRSSDLPPMLLLTRLGSNWSAKSPRCARYRRCREPQASSRRSPTR
jgi:hypothetical protein